MRSLLAIVFSLFALIATATHNRAGEISYEQIGPNTYRITLVTFTKLESDADRPFIEIDWGDGNIDSLVRDPSYPQKVDDGINKNVYIGTYTYPGPGQYTISLEDPNRNEGVNNIPNSVNVPFYIETTIINNPFLGNNSSPVLLNPPVDDACLGSPYIHNPSAFDQEGDSLVYSLVTPKGEGGEEIDGYSLPVDVSIDPNTGTLTWVNPSTDGEYNFAILIQEYRNGFLIGTMVRDMQVTVAECDNHPPQFSPVQNICIEAGQSINEIIKAYDSDSADVISLTATGGPLTEVSGTQATFPGPVLGIDSVSGTFEWNTECEHVRASAYQVIFKAEDNDPQVPLIDLTTLNITVIGPETEGLNAIATLDGINITWDPNPCSNVIGYKVYRKINSLVWEHDTCETGVPAYTGYSLVGSTTGLNGTSFSDNSTVEGNTYCYRIVACFPDGAESYSSIEVCAKTIETKPIPTHVDVKVTDQSAGEIYVQWNNPGNIDSIPDPGPFCYKVYQLIGSSKVLVYTSSGLTDTSFTHTNLNTQDSIYTYEIDLVSKSATPEIVASTSEKAGSVFLGISAGDEKLNLSWTSSTPWENDTFVVMRETSPNSGIFVEIDTITSTTFTDSSLNNGDTYCYKIQSWGYYSSDHFDVPFLNHSQIVCGVPVDIEPPCIPTIESVSRCEDSENEFSWSVVEQECNADLSTINIYYKSTPQEDYSLLTTVANPRTDSVFIDQNLISVAGCYSFSATDSTGNESSIGQEICFDNCPYYQLPNIFTPNDDAVNETLIPFPYRYIESIDLTIYNRWGQQVFKTTDKDINWDGRNMFTNFPSSSGVYFYKCVVNEIRMSGVETKTINGFIHIVN